VGKPDVEAVAAKP
jgi:hypothetical protein